MKAYLLVDVEILDAAACRDDQAAMPASVGAFGGRFIVRGGAHKVLEGSWHPTRCAGIEFPSMAQLDAWYTSPGYQPLKALRERVTRGKLVAVEGWEPPQ